MATLRYQLIYIMKKFSVLLLLFSVMACPAAKAITISRVEPANWWVGMKK